MTSFNCFMNGNLDFGQRRTSFTGAGTPAATFWLELRAMSYSRAGSLSRQLVRLIIFAAC